MTETLRQQFDGSMAHLLFREKMTNAIKISTCNKIINSTLKCFEDWGKLCYTISGNSILFSHINPSHNIQKHVWFVRANYDDDESGRIRAPVSVVRNFQPQMIG